MTESTDSVPNSLIHEKSPYLLQHAYNPVAWYPWGKEAFEKAQNEDKPIFLSIGYSTCHWCHVMAHESFEDQEVADILNRDYIPVKVDREERPDIDTIYMRVCQALTGYGGWPLTVFLTPDKEAFYAATYLPKHSKAGMLGLVELLNRISEIWDKERQQLLDSSNSIRQYLENEEKEETARDKNIGKEFLEQAFNQFQSIFDPEYGGFGNAPKFPSPHNLLFLLRYYHFTKEEKALLMVQKTLENMYRGGIYDHVGFGFARYSTDEKWLVPHFEKMLYDNALLAMAYLETYHICKEEFFGRVAREIFAYIIMDMSSLEGAFYSAEDADSEGEEGKFYTWSAEEVRDILEDKAAYFCEVYNINEKANFEGKNIPNLLNVQAGKYPEKELLEERKSLFAQREERIHPFKDDKILSGWNGLMIAAMAMGARILQDDLYLDTARRAADFIITEMRSENGRLMTSFRDRSARYPAYAVDYAYLIWGLIELYEAGFEDRYLKTALELNDELVELFWDKENAGLFFYGKDGEKLLMRPKESYDGAMPSDNAVAAYNFLRLARLTGNADLETKAEEQFKHFVGKIGEYPAAHAFWMTAATFYLYPGREIVVAGKYKSKESKHILQTIQENFSPNTIVIFKDENDEQADIFEYTRDMHSINEMATVYICEGFACRQPVVDIDDLRSLL